MAKHLSGWNLYMGEEMKRLKDSPLPRTDRLKLVGTQWHQLSQREKDVWNSQAHDLIIGAEFHEEKPSPKSRRLSGYNIFVREQTKVIKSQIKDRGDRMRAIGELWRALSKTEQDIWNAQATM